MADRADIYTSGTSEEHGPGIPCRPKAEGRNQELLASTGALWLGNDGDAPRRRTYVILCSIRAPLVIVRCGWCMRRSDDDPYFLGIAFKVLMVLALSLSHSLSALSLGNSLMSFSIASG